MSARPYPVAPHGGRHDEFGARTFDRVGDVEVRVGGEGRVALPEQQIAGGRVAAVPQVQHHVFGEWPHFVDIAGRVDERHHRVDLRGRQAPDRFEPTAGRRVLHASDPSGSECCDVPATCSGGRGLRVRPARGGLRCCRIFGRATSVRALLLLRIHNRAALL